MKVALVIDDALARPDGVQEYVRTVAAYLGSRHEVHVLCSGDAGDPPPGVAAVHSLTRNVGVTFNGNGLRTPLPASRRRLRELLERERYDVIHVQAPHSPLFAARVVDAARRIQARTVRIVGTFHILPDGSDVDLGTRALGRLLAGNLRRFDAFCAVSAPAAAFAERAFRIRCDVIPNAVDVAAVRGQAGSRPWKEPSTGRVVIAFLGRLVERKGAAELVEALAAMPYEARDLIEVRIAGRGPLREPVGASVEAHGLGGIVTFEGFVSDEDKPGFLAAADIAVFPATGGESFGIVLIEAMAAGAGAVLGGDNPGYRWTLDNDDAVVEPHDPAAFAERLWHYVTDEKSRAELRRQQQSRVGEFDIAKVGAQLEKLYGW